MEIARMIILNSSDMIFVTLIEMGVVTEPLDSADIGFRCHVGRSVVIMGGHLDGSNQVVADVGSGFGRCSFTSRPRPSRFRSARISRVNIKGAATSIARHANRPDSAKTFIGCLPVPIIHWLK